MPDPADGLRLDLVRGEVVVPPPMAKHGIVCTEVTWVMKDYVKPRKLGWVTTNDTGVVVEKEPEAVRGPDVAFRSITRQPELPKATF